MRVFFFIFDAGSSLEVLNGCNKLIGDRKINNIISDRRQVGIVLHENKIVILKKAIKSISS